MIESEPRNIHPAVLQSRHKYFIKMGSAIKEVVC
jgi:hypothetical protein